MQNPWCQQIETLGLYLQQGRRLAKPQATQKHRVQHSDHITACAKAALLPLSQQTTAPVASLADLAVALLT